MSVLLGHWFITGTDFAISMTQLVGASAVNRDIRWGYIEFRRRRRVFVPEGVARRHR